MNASRTGILLVLVVALAAFAVGQGSCSAEDGDDSRQQDDDDDSGPNTDDDTGDDDTGDDDAGDDDTEPDPIEDILLIWGSDQAESAALAEVFVALGYSVTRLKESEITQTNAEGYDLIVLAADTQWNNIIYAGHVMDTGSRIFGIYWGGALFYDTFGYTLGFAGGITFDGETAVEAADQGDAIWSDPADIPIDGEGKATLFDSIQYCHARNITSPPASVEIFGYVPSGDRHVAIGIEDGRYLYWGYETRVDDLNEAGRDLIGNLLVLLNGR